MTPDPISGVEWVIDASGCDIDALRDAQALQSLFSALVDAGRLTPVAPAVWHRFPHTGGLTGLQVLAESHLTCHTFPEHGSICLNVFCCAARPDWELEPIVRRLIGAQHIDIRRIERAYAAVASVSVPSSATS